MTIRALLLNLPLNNSFIYGKWQKVLDFKIIATPSHYSIFGCQNSPSCLVESDDDWFWREWLIWKKWLSLSIYHQIYSIWIPIYKEIFFQRICFFKFFFFISFPLWLNIDFRVCLMLANISFRKGKALVVDSSLCPQPLLTTCWNKVIPWSIAV